MKDNGARPQDQPGAAGRAGRRLSSFRLLVTVAIVAVALAAAAPAPAQEQTGGLYGTVRTGNGAPLAGARVELAGFGAPRVQTTDAQGAFRFPKLDPGIYHLTATRDGFSTVKYDKVTIRVGRDTTLAIELAPTITDVVEVISETPVLDPRKISRGTTISQIELEKIPTARDPWAIVTQTPGVLSDRINVGGNESGQQAMFTAPAATDADNAFALDGVVVTDMAAVGSSPTYYDFDQLQEIQVSTGGTDVEKVTSGASLNLVTKRGTNTPRGSARFLRTDASKLFGLLEQPDPDVAGELENGDGAGGLVAQSPADTPGNSVDEVLDLGVEAGGPIVADRLWLWGSYGRNDIKQFAQNGDPDDTLLENSALKLNGQATTADSLVASWNRGDKIKQGRRPGSNFSSSATWNQDGPTEIWKLEDVHVLSPDLFLDGLYSHVDGGFELQSRGGSYPGTVAIADEPLLDTDGVWKNSYFSGISDRNSDDYQADGSYFFTTGGLSHELKAGFSYRTFEVESAFGYPGRNVRHRSCEGTGLCGSTGGLDIAEAFRTSATPHRMTYTAGWAQDTLSAGPWTLNAGLRYDVQEGENLASVVQANPAVPDLLPAIDFPGNDAGGLKWQTLSPRLGVTYALGAERKTLLRASVSRFAEQLSSVDVTRVNPTGPAFYRLLFDDTNGDNIWEPGEEATPIRAVGVDPSDPTALVTPNVTDPGLDPSLTDEVVLGAEHAFLPELVVGADLTWRRVTGILETRDLVVGADGVVRPAERGDYVFDHRVASDGVTVPDLPDGTPWSADYYSLRDGLEFTGGQLLTNGDSERDYRGAGLTVTKRLSKRWMARGYFQYGKAEWQVADSTLRFDNPTDDPSAEDGTASDPHGGLFYVQSQGSGAFQDVLVQSTWSANLNGLYEIAPDRPWGFNVAGDLQARQGYPLTYYYTDLVADGSEIQAAAVPTVDRFRADDVYDLDLRLEKDVPFTAQLSGILSLDAFNVTNRSSVLQRDRELNAGTANFLTESLSPRIYRLGFRLSWR